MVITGLSILCFATNTFAGKKKELNKAKLRRGSNVFEMKIFPADTFTVEDPFTGEHIRHITVKEPIPVSLNKQQIHIVEEASMLPVSIEKNIKEYLLSKLAKDFQKLENGKYRFSFSNIVINSKGKIVYYDYDVLNGPFDNRFDFRMSVKASNASVMKTIDKKIARYMKKAPYFDEAELNRNKIPCLIDGNAFNYLVSLKDGELVK